MVGIELKGDEEEKIYESLKMFYHAILVMLEVWLFIQQVPYSQLNEKELAA